jgi:predicted N-acyltransferase
MQSTDIVAIPNGRARLVSRAEVETIPAWENSFARQAKDHRYYEILEDTLRDPFEHHYLVLENEAGEARAIQPVFFLRQNLTEGVTGRVRDALDGVRKKFPRFLTMRVLMAGCAAGDGQLDDSLASREWIARGLRASLETFARNHKASLVILKDFPSEYRSLLDMFSSAGYARVPSMPLTRLQLDYRDFDDYLNSLGSATRKNMRRKYRKALQGPPIEREILTDPAPYLDEMLPLYLQVHNRSPMKFETLTTDYFRALAARMPERTKFFFWRQQGKLIAFSFCLVHNDTIYDECLGLDYPVALELHLYYYTIREILSWAIEQGLKFYCSTPLNYDPKLHLGCSLAPLDLYVRHTTRALNPIFGRMVKLLEPTRHDPVLRHFPNAHELLS